MTRLTIGALVIRVWRTEKPEVALAPDNRDLIKWAADHPYRNKQHPVHFTCGLGSDYPSLILELEKFPRVAAIEILDRTGNGLILYPDWH